MDLAQTLLRSTVRSFYPPEQIIIMDAVLLHSALRDDDLAFLMGMQTKALRKSCSKLREDGLLSVHSRQETREGANRPFARDYYFVDTHRAIDVIKFRLKSMAKMVDAKYGQTVGEKKEYRCARCKSTYTELEVLDNISDVGILCKRCSNPLDRIDDEANGNGAAAAAGHEVQSRLNAQMMPFEDLLRRIDGAEIPENTFDDAIDKAIAVKRDESVNPAAKTTVLEKARLPPQTVHGMKTEEKIEISLMDDTARREHERKEAQARAKFREENQLPSWWTDGTVDAAAAANDSSTQPMPNGSPVGQANTSEAKFDKGKDDEEDQKKADEALLNSIYEMEDDEDEDEEEDSDEESDDEEDEGKPPAKKVKIEEPPTAQNGGPVNGVSKEIEDAYGDSGEESGEE